MSRRARSAHTALSRALHFALHHPRAHDAESLPAAPSPPASPARRIRSPRSQREETRAVTLGLVGRCDGHRRASAPLPPPAGPRAFGERPTARGPVASSAQGSPRAVPRPAMPTRSASAGSPPVGPVPTGAPSVPLGRCLRTLYRVPSPAGPGVLDRHAGRLAPAPPIAMRTLPGGFRVRPSLRSRLAPLPPRPVPGRLLRPTLPPTGPVLRALLARATDASTAAPSAFGQ